LQISEQGKPKLEAILEASEARLRPILMTSLAISLGALLLPCHLVHPLVELVWESLLWAELSFLSSNLLFLHFILCGLERKTLS
jgi:Cu/Ag efflux pump CusA